MANSRQYASHSLRMVKELSARGLLCVNGRSLRWIRNHLGRFDGREIIQRVIESTHEEDFQKSVELNMQPGTWADVYRYVMTGDEELDGDEGWYVKVFIDESGVLRLSVLSANWEGYIH